jgi:hypothetical protein
VLGKRPREPSRSLATSPRQPQPRRARSPRIDPEQRYIRMKQAGWKYDEDVSDGYWFDCYKHELEEKQEEARPRKDEEMKDW